MDSMTPPNWHGENELITEVEADFGEVVLLDGVKSLKSITRYSNELARSSVVALDAALRDRMVRDVASKMDAAFIAGTGDVVDGKRTTPLGLLNYPGVQEVTGVGAPNLDALLDAIGLLIAANVDPTRCRLFMASRDWIAVRKLKDGGGKYVLQPDPTADGVFRLFGIPVTVTNRIPIGTGTGKPSTMVLADFSQIAVARDMAPSVKILFRALRRLRPAGDPRCRALRRRSAQPSGRRAAARRHGRVTLPEGPALDPARPAGPHDLCGCRDDERRGGVGRPLGRR